MTNCPVGIISIQHRLGTFAFFSTSSRSAILSCPAGPSSFILGTISPTIRRTFLRKSSSCPFRRPLEPRAPGSRPLRKPARLLNPTPPPPPPPGSAWPPSPPVPPGPNWAGIMGRISEISPPKLGEAGRWRLQEQSFFLIIQLKEMF